MRGLSSSRSQRLAKQRATADNNAPIHSPVSPLFPVPKNIPPIQTSYDELKDDRTRRMLREQLGGTFPETGMAGRSSEDSVRGSNGLAPLKDRFKRRSSGQDIAMNASAHSSSSTVNSVGPKRLSVVPESNNNNKAIDIEKAIQLLQELKKTASPDELVALHRALLPTKEVETVTSPRDSVADQRAPFSTSPSYRRRSALPPGLATRGGVSEDLLRKPGEKPAEAIKVEKRPTGRLTHSNSSNGHAFRGQAVSISSLEALDLADDSTNYMTTRAVTPLEYSFGHAGGYRPGTLHITNGAASPEPSIRTMITAEPATIAAPDEEDGYLTSEDRPAEHIMPVRAKTDVPPARSSIDSIRVRDKILSSDKAQQQRKVRAQRMSGMSTPSKESLLSVKQQSSQLSMASPRHSIDRDKTPDSPVSAISNAPRFQQRWSHRASQISAEYMSDCELSASPYEDKNNALLNFATRLSTVFDDADDEDAKCTPEVALSRLTGDPAVMETSSLPTGLPLSPMTTAPQDAQSMPISRRPLPQKGDSGYGSELTYTTSPKRSSSDVRRTSSSSLKRTFIATDEGLNEVHEPESSDPDDAKSLYTFADILKSPALLQEFTPPREQSGSSEPQTPSSPSLTRAKKSASFLRLHTLKAEKMAAAGSTDTIPTIASMQSALSNGSKTSHLAKQQRKLQKPIPEAVRRRQREEWRRRRVSQTAPELPAIPDAGLDISYVANTRDMDLPEVCTPVVDQTHSGPASAVAVAEETPAQRGRSKTVGRGRSKSIRQTGDGEPAAEAQRGWSIAKLRSKSASRARASVDLSAEQAAAKKQGTQAASPVEELPAWTDFASVARSLGAGSYDISTNQMKHVSVPVPGATHHELQSPYLYSTGLAKGKHAKSKGMNNEAAAEYARMKSRDIGIENATPSQDRPRMAQPGSSSRKRSKSPASTRRVEDRFPDWQSKPASRVASPQRPPNANRPHSMYAESIPPLPEMPADVEVKASKADQIVAKKFARTSPISARTSGELAQRRELAEYGNQLVPVVTAVEIHKEASNALLHPAERPPSAAAGHISVQVRELSGSGSEQSSFVETPNEEAVTVQTPSHDAQHSGWPGWEQQAAAWRQRRESLGHTLGKPVDDEILVVTADSPPTSRKPSERLPIRRGTAPTSPSIVVSRYITPLASETAARANMGTRPADAATQRANIYRELIGDDKENRPAKEDIPRTDSAQTTASAASFVTVKSWNARPPARNHFPRTETVVESKAFDGSYSTVTTTTTTLTSRAISPGGHVRTTSGKFIPYSPSKQDLAEQLRAESLAKLTGGNASTTSLGAIMRNGLASKSSESIDRYSGGLEFGWERGAGFNGSAGTRLDGSEAKRKSVKMSETWGIDLSDVPVILQRSG